MRAQRTSKDSYQRVIDAGDDETLKRKVTAVFLQRGPMTRREAHRHLDHGWSSTTARMRELLDEDILEPTGETRTDPETKRDGQLLEATKKAEPYLKGELDKNNQDPANQMSVRQAAHRMKQVNDQFWPTTEEAASRLNDLYEALRRDARWGE